MAKLWASWRSPETYPADVALQVDDAKSAVLWTTLGTMGSLFLVLFGFIVVADVSIYRSNRREMSMVEEANHTLEDRVQQRTQALAEAQDQASPHREAGSHRPTGSRCGPRSPKSPGGHQQRRLLSEAKAGASEVAQSNPRVPQFLQIVEDEVAHSNQIITDLMTFTRVNTPFLAPTISYGSNRKYLVQSPGKGERPRSQGVRP